MAAAMKAVDPSNYLIPLNAMAVVVVVVAAVAVIVKILNDWILSSLINLIFQARITIYNALNFLLIDFFCFYFILKSSMKKNKKRIIMMNFFTEISTKRCVRK